MLKYRTLIYFSDKEQYPTNRGPIETAVGGSHPMRRTVGGVEFPVRRNGPDQPGPSNSTPDNTQGKISATEPPAETPRFLEGADAGIVQELGRSGFANPNAESRSEQTEDGTQEAPDNEFGNTSTLPLRRSARIPNTKPRELYPGSIGYA